MTNRLLLSVAAAALIAGTGFANAQGTGMSRESPSSGSTAQQQPSSGGGAMQHERSGTAGPKGADSGMKADSADKAQPGAGKSAQDKSAPERSKSMSSESETKGSKDMKAEGRDKSGSTAAESRERDRDGGTAQTQTKSPTDARSQTTTGAAATSATAAPPAEKRTQIVSAIKSERVEEVTNVNFNVSVGAVVPATVRFHALPTRIVEIYPEWRGYQFILIKGRYVIVRPETHEIVYIIEG